MQAALRTALNPALGPSTAGHGTTTRGPAARPDRRAATLLLHWASALLLLLAVAGIVGREWAEDPAWRTLLLDMHRQCGLAVMLAWLPRLIARHGHGAPHRMPSASPLERRAAQGVHGTLYGLLLALPVLGWATSNAHAVHLRLFGLLPLPDLVGPNADLADQLSDWHAWCAWALMALVAVHVGAALWHHWIKRDDVLTAMLPRRQA